jgi:hypothetical protein
MITRRSGKPCGLNSQRDVRMEYIAANMIVVLKMNPADYRCKLQWFSTVPQFAISRSKVVCLIKGINGGVQLP